MVGAAIALVAAAGIPLFDRGESSLPTVADEQEAGEPIQSRGMACSQHSQQLCSDLGLTPSAGDESCHTVYLLCDDGLLPRDALACCNLNGPLLIYSQSMCQSLGLRSGAYCSADFDKQLAKPVECKTFDSECVEKIKAACTAQHERTHDKDFRTPRDAPSSCDTEQNAFKTEQECLQSYFDQFCSSTPSSKECTALSKSLCGAAAGLATNSCICGQPPLPSDGATESEWSKWAGNCAATCAQTPLPSVCAPFEPSKEMPDFTKDYCEQQQPPDKETQLCYENAKSAATGCTQGDPGCYTACVTALEACQSSARRPGLPGDRNDAIRRSMCSLWINRAGSW